MENNSKSYLGGMAAALGNLTPCMPSIEQERGQPEIGRKVSELQSVVACAGEKFEKLASRLGPIRRPIDVKDPSPGQSVGSSVCDLGGQLEDIIQRLHRLVGVIDDVANTLEI